MTEEGEGLDPALPLNKKEFNGIFKTSYYE
jgi:hypothetical protein